MNWRRLETVAETVNAPSPIRLKAIVGVIVPAEASAVFTALNGARRNPAFRYWPRLNVASCTPDPTSPASSASKGMLIFPIVDPSGNPATWGDETRP